ncbi:MAG: Adenylosuccinate lyase [Steroidobacteraceae bacterium]|nr:Adenylosuccinate lyase [Steroidobacteraceae bacterium]
MSTASLDALSPVDGRYRRAADPLRPILSEQGLVRERIRIEAEWFRFLVAEVPAFRALASPAVLARAAALAADPEPDAAARVKETEARINHDVKAVEYYVRDALAAAGAAPAALELVHFGCTSEDINNTAYARLLVAARALLLGAIDARMEALWEFVDRYAALAMIARTHGQTASPTTLGKEFANVAQRLARARARFAAVAALAKWNGAVGNYNAHVAAFPQLDWPALGERFIGSLGLAFNTHTTQIEPHDWIAEYCDALAAINVILLDFCRDAWGYVSLGYLRQRAVAGEVGSSTMPHKVNPIDFENAEGNLGIANALLRHFAEKLPVSRWQRDLTDSTVLRNLGVALAHTLIAWQSIGRGLGKIEANPARIAADLDGAWEVLAEAVQTVLRAHGVPNGYERLKDFTRGRPIDAAMLGEFIDGLPLPDGPRARLRGLGPAGYTGLAAQLARQSRPRN